MTPQTKHLPDIKRLTLLSVLTVTLLANLMRSNVHAVDYSFDANGTTNWTVIPWTPAGTPGSGDNVSVSSAVASSTLSLNTDGVTIGSFTKSGASNLFLNAVTAPRTFTVESLFSVTEGTFTLRNQNSNNILTVGVGGFAVAPAGQFVLGLANPSAARPVFTASSGSTNLMQGTMLVNGYNTAVQTTQPAVQLGHLVLEGGSLNISAGTAGQRTANTVNVSSLSSLGSGTRTVTTSDNDGVTAVSTLVIGGLNGTTTPADFGGFINNNINVVKEGAGTQIFSGANTYNGSTTVSAGALIVNGSIGGSVLSVASNAALGGTGTIGAATTISGTLAPGNSIGTLTVNNDVTWNAGNNWVFELGAAGPDLATPGTSDMLTIGGGSDFLRGTGTGWTFDFAGTGDAGWYKLVDWTGGSTTFDVADFSGVNLANGYSSEFDILDDALYVNVIPEPSTYVLMALGSVALLQALRRRRKNS